MPRTAARRSSLSPPPSAPPSTRSSTSTGRSPIDDSAFHLPPELLPLYGTAAWDAMTPRPSGSRTAATRPRRCAAPASGSRTCSCRWCCATSPSCRSPIRPTATCSSRSPTSAATRRCSASTSAAPARPPTVRRSPRTRSPTPTHAERRAVSYLLILAVEELLDYMNRATMRDERVHPISRAMAQAARARRGASRELRQDLPRGVVGRRSTTIDAPRGCRRRAGTRRGCRRSERRPRGLRAPRHRERRRASPARTRTTAPTILVGLAKLTAFLTEIGVIDDDHRGLGRPRSRRRGGQGRRLTLDAFHGRVVERPERHRPRGSVASAISTSHVPSVEVRRIRRARRPRSSRGRPRRRA